MELQAESWSCGSGFVHVFPFISLLYTAEEYSSNTSLAFIPTAERRLEVKSKLKFFFFYVVRCAKLLKRFQAFTLC